ncbi:MAG: DUF1579 domain-containing protein [Pirellulales bacterium]|nr:DUF1579 domain-containing protein [Pirellulales bacterium]
MRLLCCALLSAVMTVTASAQQPPKPTEHHKLLQKDVGTWTGTMSMMMPGASEPMVMPVKEVNKMMDGGLWLTSDFESGPFKGHGQFGYDTEKKKFVGTWIDNSSSSMAVMEGDFDKDKGHLVMTFRALDQASGQVTDMKSVSSFDGDDKRKFVMYAKRSGKWAEVFQINYERSK